MHYIIFSHLHKLLYQHVDGESQSFRSWYIEMVSESKWPRQNSHVTNG